MRLPRKQLYKYQYIPALWFSDGSIQALSGQIFCRERYGTDVLFKQQSQYKQDCHAGPKLQRASKNGQAVPALKEASNAVMAFIRSAAARRGSTSRDAHKGHKEEGHGAFRNADNRLAEHARGGDVPEGQEAPDAVGKGEAITDSYSSKGEKHVEETGRNRNQIEGQERG